MIENTSNSTSRRHFLKTTAAPLLTAAVMHMRTDTAEAHGTNGWHNLQQWEREKRILDRAAQDIGKWGGQCKSWIQGVVWSASAGHVWLPANSPTPYIWLNDPNNHVVQFTGQLEWQEIGTIVQLETPSGPHTALIAGISKWGVIFVDANWGWDQQVKVHSLTFESFYALLKTSGTYTLYRVR